MCFYLSGLSFLVHLCLSKKCTYDGTLSIIYILLQMNPVIIVICTVMYIYSKCTVIIAFFNVLFFEHLFLINFPYQSLTLR